MLFRSDGGELDPSRRPIDNPAYFAVHDPLLPLALVAGHTSRIGLGVATICAPFTAPALLAKAAASLDVLCDGRLTLGLGSGLAASIERLGVANAKPLRRIVECFGTVRALLAGEEVNGAKLSFKPMRADMPILMAARGPNALALAGKIADGLMISNMCPPGFAAWAAGVAKPKRMVQYVPCAVGPDRDKATAATRTGR